MIDSFITEQGFEVVVPQVFTPPEYPFMDNLTDDDQDVELDLQ